MPFQVICDLADTFYLSDFIFINIHENMTVYCLDLKDPT